MEALPCCSTQGLGPAGEAAALARGSALERAVKLCKRSIRKSSSCCRGVRGVLGKAQEGSGQGEGEGLGAKVEGSQ